MNFFKGLKRKFDIIIVGCVAVLAIVSIVMIGSTHISSGFIARDTIIQTTAYLIGIGLCVVISKFHYSTLKGNWQILYAVAVMFLLLVYVPGLGMVQFGSRAWINLRVTTIQPSEFVKILFILLMAEYLEKNKYDLYNFKGLIKAVLFAAPIILIVLKEDLGSALVFSSIWLFMIFYAGINLKVLGKFFALLLAFIPVAYLFMAQYQKDRIEAFLHPDNLNLPGNYQVFQGKVAMGSGGIFGTGIFNGTQKGLDFIPVQTSDFIFSVIIEELGFIGGLILIAIFTILLFRMTQVVREMSDMYGALIIIGVIGMLSFQIFENIAMNMGLMPVTGITLPFLSYGGTSIMASMISIGLVLNIATRNRGISF
ncbi:FtsW/RodA/SpoVE family cell cycle protein [Eubacteriales bacterium KG127]